VAVQVGDGIDVVNDAVGVLIGHLVIPVGIEVEAGHASLLGLVMWWLCTRWSFRCRLMLIGVCGIIKVYLLDGWIGYCDVIDDGGRNSLVKNGSGRQACSSGRRVRELIMRWVDAEEATWKRLGRIASC
jgi:hypothetical protein